MIRATFRPAKSPSGQSIVGESLSVRQRAGQDNPSNKPACNDLPSHTGNAPATGGQHSAPGAWITTADMEISMSIRARISSLSLLLLAVAPDATALTCTSPDIDLSSYSKVLIPRGHGRVQDVSVAHDALYPSHKQNMQFMLFFNTNSSTAKYVQTLDPAANITRWTFVTQAGTGKRMLRLCTYATSLPSIDESTLTIDPAKPYLAAADKYKGWAFDQSWAKRKSSKMDSAKYIALGASPYLLYQKSTMLTPLLDEFTETGTSIDNPATGTWLTRWRADEFNYNYPDYWSPTTLSGSVFADHLSWLDSQGSVPLPYINAQLWDQEKTSVKSNTFQYSAADMVKNSLGVIPQYNGCPFPNHQPLLYPDPHCLVYVCPTVTSWQTLILDARNSLLDATSPTPQKSKGVYYDMLASAEPQMCADTDHDHDVDDPQFWQSSYRSILSNTDGVVMVEGFAEVYIDLVDVFLMHLETNNPSDSPFASTSTVPLWKAVYGTISRSAGWYIDESAQTPTNMLDELKKAKAFGSWTWGSPWLAPTGNGNDLDYQAKLTDTSDNDTSHARYQDVLAMIATAPLYKENGSNGTANWAATGNVSNSNDADYGKNVIVLTGTGVAYTTPNWTGTGDYTQARWSMKRSSSPMYAGFKVLTQNNGTVYLYYTADSLTHTYKAPGSAPPYYTYHGVGEAPSANGWQTFDRDLDADLKDFFPNDEITAVQGFVMFNNSGKVVDIKLFKRAPVF
jgi:hypothetical protein